MRILAFLRSGMLVSLVASSFACRPKVGDKCTTSNDCSTQGDRICDTTQAEGYCTVFGCEPDQCPSESVCVGFGRKTDPSACSATQQWARFERTFCVRTCDTASDCRAGYACVEASQLSSGYDAEIIDTDPNGTRACVIAVSPAPAASAPSSCRPASSAFVVPYSNASGGSGGTGGENQSGGAAGASGQAGAAGVGGKGGNAGQSGASGGQGGGAGNGGSAGAAGEGGGGAFSGGSGGSGGGAFSGGSGGSGGGAGGQGGQGGA